MTRNFFNYPVPEQFRCFSGEMVVVQRHCWWLVQSPYWLDLRFCSNLFWLFYSGLPLFRNLSWHQNVTQKFMLLVWQRTSICRYIRLHMEIFWFWLAGQLSHQENLAFGAKVFDFCLWTSWAAFQEKMWLKYFVF